MSQGAGSARGTCARINLDALRHNLERVRALAPESRVIAMVKSNAYGHGLVRVAQALHQADAFGVACLEEGQKLRAAGIETPITLMSGCFTGAELQEAVSFGFDLVVHREDQVAGLEQSPLQTPPRVWLKLDTGMHRLGFPPEQAHHIHRRLSSIAWVQQPIGLMTHLADADDPGKATTSQQLDRFHALVEGLPGPRSIANSAGIVAWPQSHADWVRPGIMLYGVSPVYNKTAETFGLKPVMTLESRLMEIKRLKQGDAVGYGGQWTCPEDMPVGVVAIGYGDGYPRHAKNGTPVLINDCTCPLVGRVSMDMLTVDLRNCTQACIGDRVVLWGAGLPAEQVANFCDTIAYELFCLVTARVETLAMVGE